MYDVLIVGAGPAGLTAGIYCARYGLKTLIIEKGLVGGTANLANTVQNWPGIKNISGIELMNNFREHAISSGAEIKEGFVKKILKGKEKKVILENEEIVTKTIIIAVGSKSKWLKVKGEKEFFNKGVHFCATCDGAIYSEKNVAIIGSDNRAIEEANYLKKIAKKVFIITEKKELEAEKAKTKDLEGVEIITDARVTGFEGKQFLEKIILKDLKGEEKEIFASAAFIYAGTESNSENFDLKKDSEGSIIVDEQMRTSEEGVFAAGDCIKKDLKQIITSSSEGAIAAHSVSKYLK